MSSLKYNINLFYNPIQVGEQVNTEIGGVTYSTDSYKDGFYVASMPELKISATASTYTQALNNLLLVATASNVFLNYPPEPLSATRYW